MAIVLALVIVGWLTAFSLGAQAGFENEPAVTKHVPKRQASPAKTATAGNPISVA